VIRILLVDLPSALEAAVHRALQENPDLVVVGSACGDMASLLDAGQAAADVVIIRTDSDELPALAERLMDEYSKIGVLALDVNRDRAFIYDLRPHRTRIDSLTPSVLARAIRRAAGQEMHVTPDLPQPADGR